MSEVPRCQAFLSVGDERRRKSDTTYLQQHLPRQSITIKITFKSLNNAPWCSGYQIRFSQFDLKVINSHGALWVACIRANGQPLRSDGSASLIRADSKTSAQERFSLDQKESLHARVVFTVKVDQ